MIFYSDPFLTSSSFQWTEFSPLPVNLKIWVQVQALLFIKTVVIDKAFNLFSLLFYGQ